MSCPPKDRGVEATHPSKIYLMIVPKLLLVNPRVDAYPDQGWKGAGVQLLLGQDCVELVRPEEASGYQADLDNREDAADYIEKGD
jgi:hypothetical protein